MSNGAWRWLAVGLLAVNLALGLLVLFPGAPVESARPAIAPLDPGLPLLELVGEINHASRGQNREVCFTIGPLSTLMSQQRALDRLRPFAAASRTRETSADNDRGWWVYLPAGNRSAAISLSRELAERGVEDFYVVTSGSLENTVSVGLYENADNARSRQARLVALGYDARIEVRRETVPQFWVDYRIGSEDRSPWRFIVRASPGSQHREIPCWDE